MHRTQHCRQANTTDAAQDDIKRHVNFGVLTVEFLGSDVNAAARRYDDANGLVNDVDALEDIDGVIVIGVGDAKDVDGVDESVDDAVAGLDTDDELST